MTQHRWDGCEEVSEVGKRIRQAAGCFDGQHTWSSYTVHVAHCFRRAVVLSFDVPIKPGIFLVFLHVIPKQKGSTGTKLSDRRALSSIGWVDGSAVL